MLVALVAVNGAPTFVSLASGIFDLTGTFELRGTVPNGLAGKTLVLSSYAIAASGKLVDTFDEALELR